ncbi:S1 family peptidase [Burkholderia sp. PU8-34]
MKKTITLALALSCVLSLPAHAQVPGLPFSQTSAPLFTDSVNKQQHMVTGAVFRIICNDKRVMGTGFLHNSGDLITADHVVSGCQHIVFLQPDGSGGALVVGATIVAEDQELDLALLKPVTPLPDTPLALSPVVAPAPGSLVTTWGFPGGYGGVDPIVSVGYFSGSDLAPTPSGKQVKQWVVNAAFNHGNSGGPLIDAETGAVIGVVDNKIVPLSSSTLAALNAMSNNKFGMMYAGTQPDGKTVQISEAQVAAQVLFDLASQVQLVIGRAVPSTTVRDFLKAHGIDP